jgi:asparagine synthase (glutamine-hydrolysing)
MLPPGHVLTVEPAGRVSIERYWDQLASASDQAGHVGVVECRQRLGELLRESAALHLVSDVPVGVFLSGGIDSSALVSLLRDAGETPRTFSVTFREEAHDESRHARAVAAHFGTDHAEIRLEGDALADAVPEIMARVDHPSGDGINTAVIAQAVRGAGIKVALSGLGGDEIFGGYQSFVRLRRWSAWSPLWARVPGHLRELAASTVDGLGRSAAATKAAAVLRTDGRLAGAYPPLRQVFSPAERAQLLASAVWQRTAGVPDPYVAFLEEAFRGADRIDVTTLVSYAEARTYMHDVLLRDTDQMSMASGLEVRVPLLDHQVVQYVTGLPGALKCGGATPKALLTESLSSPLPDTVVRRPKQGFVLPLDTWMRGPLRDFCADHLAPERLGSRGAFSAAGRASVWQRFLGGDPRVTWSRVWALIALDVWLERSGVEFHGQ